MRVVGGAMGRRGEAEREEEEEEDFYSSAARSLVCFGGHFFHRLMGADEASSVFSLTVPPSERRAAARPARQRQRGRLLKQHVSPNATHTLTFACVCVELLTSFDTAAICASFGKKKKGQGQKKKK